MRGLESAIVAHYSVDIVLKRAQNAVSCIPHDLLSRNESIFCRKKKEKKEEIYVSDRPFKTCFMFCTYSRKAVRPSLVRLSIVWGFFPTNSLSTLM